MCRMKKLFLSYLFVLLASLCFASPFGLKMGMTIEEIAEVCETEPITIKDGIYLVKPINSHPIFDYYAVYITDQTGLYQIRAMSSSIQTNKYGTELKNAFNNVKDRIAKTYGKPQVTDEYIKKENPYKIFQQGTNGEQNSIYDNIYKMLEQSEDKWFYSLKEGEYELYAVWGKNTKLKDNIDVIALECKYVDGFYEGNGRLVLTYYFNNYDSVEDEQDSVF